MQGIRNLLAGIIWLVLSVVGKSLSVASGGRFVVASSQRWPLIELVLISFFIHL